MGRIQNSQAHDTSGSAGLSIDIAGIESVPIWSDYCAGHPGALFSQLPGWCRTLADTYRLPLFVLRARENDSGETTVGLLPLLLFAPPGNTRRLISLPYTDAAGVLADSEDVRHRLLLAALQLAEELAADHLEVREYRPEPVGGPPPDLDSRWVYREFDFKIGLQRSLPETADTLWASLGSKVRNQVRKAERCGCRCAIGGSELLDDFYAVFSENMRDLGSPTHSIELFHRLLDHDEPSTRCLVVSCDGVPAAGAIVLRSGETLANPWASSLRRFRPRCPNMLLYWSMLRLAVEQGCRRFDFGRSSRDTPTHRFKKQWGAVPRRLCWQVFSRSMPLWRPDNESLVAEQWRLMDLESSRRCGPARRRWISL
jgi:FemAB-related protein (PEP-CTERM system-associated)